MASVPAWAAEAAAEDTAPEVSTDILVTGSRIVRDGYEAPTPTTVLGVAEIATTAPNNIADLVNRLPALAGSATPRSNLGQISNGGTGINALNLRNLGPARTLILLDGKRVPVATINTGLVDVNFMPNLLVERVDIVTGGASAVYGSDAVAGVVNFVLDNNFVGLKGDIQGGVSNYGDGENYRLGLAYGTKFAGGRGHFLISAEHAFNAGITGAEYAKERNWYKGTKAFINPNYTPANGQPERLVMDNVGLATAAPGAIVTSGPLAGLYFGANGTPAQLNADLTSGAFMTGADWRYTDFGLGVQDMDPRISRQNIFTRASYEISDNVKIYGQFSYGRASTSMHSTPQFNFGGITIQQDNAFLPTEIAQNMTRLGLTSLNVGSWNADLGGIKADTKRSQYRYLAGLTGNFDMLGSNWVWDVSANRNVSKIYNSALTTITANYRNAIDAVRDDNGVIVCRSSLTNPNNGCVPYNILGTGTASDAAKNYVLGTSELNASLTQNVFAGSLRGEPFSTWAGPVSVAVGAEHRREKLSGRADDLSMMNSFWAGNFKPISGSYNVSEAFAEAVVPLVKDGFVKDLDINGAIRATNYSTSGYVTTWKIGGNLTPVEGLRFRVTRSRDIRAGNFSELYAAGQTNTDLIADPFRNNESVTIFSINSGNPNLRPEKADTLGLGVVVQPRALPGFSASVDYFDIRVRDAVGTVGTGTILSECFRGDQQMCGQIVRDSGGILKEIRVQPINIAQQRVRGFDVEASYNIDLKDIAAALGGDFTLRGLATRYTKATSDNGLTNPTSSLGTIGLPKWQYLVQGTYRDERATVSLTGRGFSSGVYNTNFIECSSNCPASTPQNMTINNNRVAGALYFDAYVGYKVLDGSELYLAVDNVANKKPATYAHGPGIGSAPYGSNAHYDLIGRMFRAGIRFKY